MRVVDLSGVPGAMHTDDAKPAAPLGPMSRSDQPQRSSRLLDAFGARRARQQAHAEDLRLAGAELMRTARRAGGSHAEDSLKSELGDDWILVRGYQNSAGRIGQLLVGTHGVVAVTSLHLDATVRVHGDTWHVERIDKNQQSLGEFDLEDQAGLSPSAQLNRSADEFGRLLHAAGIEVSVLRAILLNHFRSRLEESRRPTVEIFTGPYELGAWLRKRPKVLDRGQRRKIEELLTGHTGHTDHHHPQPS